jgi:hypothetical protein
MLGCLLFGTVMENQFLIKVLIVFDKLLLQFLRDENRKNSFGTQNNNIITIKVVSWN